MKKTVAMALVGAMTCSLLSGCGNSGSRTNSGSTTAAGGDTAAAESAANTTTGGAADMPEVSTTLAIMLAPDHPQCVAAQNILAKEVSDATGGKFKIDVQTNGALGSDSETVEATIMGTMDMTGTSAATLAAVDPSWYILDVPYVFTSKEQAREALDGKLGEYLSNSLEESCGMICLGFGESGMRNLSNNSKEITAPADLSGMKIRVLENKYHLATFQALGANPTAMSFSEVYTAMQTKQIDGQDNPITITSTNKFYEVQKHYTLTEHMFCANTVTVNAKWFRSLPESYQQILKDAVKNMIKEQRRLIDENEKVYLKEMEEKGCKVTTLTDEQKQGFADATQKVRDDFAKEFGESGKTMIDLAAEYEK